MRLGEGVVGIAVQDAGVVDQDVDLAERSDELRDAGQVPQVEDDLARVLVEGQDAEP